MLKYTKAAVDKIKEDLKIAVVLFEIIMLLLLLTYLIFALTKGIGHLITNIILIVVISIYLIIYLLNLKFKFKCFRTVIKKYYKVIRLTILACSLGVTLYELYVTTSDVNPVTIILITLLIIFWILQVVIEVIYRLMINEIDLLMQAIAQDKDDTLSPVKNMLHIEEHKTKSKKILKLEKKIEKELEKEKRS